jgi:hypothetical protein
MRQFTIDIYNNRTKKIVREAIKFEGDLQTVRKFALSLAKRLKLADGTAYIYDRNIMKEILIAIHETVAPAAQPFYASTLTAVALFLLWTIIIRLAANSTIK